MCEQLKQQKKQKLQSWESEKETLSDRYIDAEIHIDKRNVIKGNIFMCQLGENLGHEQCRKRPVLVLQGNKNTGTVIIMPLTTKLRNQTDGNMYPDRYRLYNNQFEFLKEDSDVLINQIRLVSTVRLYDKLGTIEKNNIDGIVKKFNKLLK